MKINFFTPSVLLIPLFWLISFQHASSTHLMGAWFNAVQIDTGKYAVYLKVVRDCNGVPLPDPAIKYTSGAYTFTHQLDTLHLLSVRDITGIDSTCSQQSRCYGSYPYGFQEYLFADTADLSSYSNCDWEISYDGGARNSGIYPLWNGNYNFYNFMLLNKCVYNSTPYFSQDIRNLLSNYQDHKLAFSALDTMDQGDSISYELERPYYAVNSPVNYQANFGYNKPLIFFGFPSYNLALPAGFHINPVTGLVEFRPTQVNQVGVFVVQVKEWRKINGVMTVISVVRHDNMYYVIPFVNNSAPSYNTSQSTSQYQDYTVCTNDTFKLKLVFDDADGDSIRASMSGYLPGAILETEKDTGTRTTIMFKWKPDSSLIRNEPYPLTINIGDQVCPFGMKQSRTYRLFVQANPGTIVFDIGNDILDTAGFDSIVLTPSISNPGNRIVQWHTSGDGSFTNQYNPFTSYTPGPSDKQTCSYEIWLELVNKTYCGSTGSTIADSMRITRVLPDIKIDSVASPYYGDSVQLMVDGILLNGRQYSWTSSGDGYFIDSFSKAPKYVPGAKDWADCGWWIYLEYDATGCLSKRDSVFVQRSNGILSYSAPDSVMRGDTIYLTGNTNSSHQIHLHWSTAGSGVFGDTSAAQTWYLPGTQDYQNCGSQIYLSEWPKSACGRVDSIWVAKDPGVFDAGINRPMIWIDTVSLYASPMANANWNYGYWTTNGTGTFVDSNDAHTSYIPSLQDLSQCVIYLYWNEYDQDCGGRRDSIRLGRQLKTFTGGPDLEAYYSAGMRFELQGTNDTAGGYYAVWRTQGDGSFSDTLDPNAVYFPGTNDLQNCTIDLTYTEYPDGISCGINNQVKLTIRDSTVKIDGVWIDSTTFDTVYLFHHGNTGRGTFSWTSSGSGTFVIVNANVSYYVLSASDKSLTDIELTASFNPACQPSSWSIHVDPSQVKTAVNTFSAAGIQVYPNPSHDFVQLDGLPLQSILFVYTVDGKVLTIQKILEAHATVDLRQLSQGSYILVIETQDHQRFRTIIKKY